MLQNVNEKSPLQVVEAVPMPKGAVVVNGLPDVGLVGLLAASHMISELKLKEVGAIESDLLPPMIVLHGGLPKSPIRFFADSSLIVLISETTVPFSLIRPLASTIVDLAQSKSASLVLSLGGMAEPKRQDIDAPKVFAALSSKETEQTLHGAAEVLEEGYIVGAYGLILRMSAQAKIPAITLLTQSYYNYPDPEAAAATLTAVNKILNLKVSVSELLQKGEEIRLKSKDLMHRTHMEMQRMNKGHEDDLPPMYG
jgi:uncharacterized protein